jgi:hypothetical protein
MRRLLAIIALMLTTLSGPVWAGEGAERLFAERSGQGLRAHAGYGPFQVIDATRAALDGVTDARTPAQFAAMLRDHPGLAVLEMRDCPGTEDDLANLRLGRMIRAAGLQTHVPDGGSVRSGAVELFLAGVTRRIDDGAEFAVHAWIDETGLQAADYSANAPENRRYLAYYREMGMVEGDAAAFYAMTNSVPFTQARWLTAQDMRQWIRPDRAPAAPPVLAYLDLEPMLH